MSQRRVIIVQEPGKHAVETRPIPPPKEDHVQVAVKASAMNPTDWKHIDGQPIKGGSIGVDYAGVVEKVPEGYARRAWKVGDRIAGGIHGGNQDVPTAGSFATTIQAQTGVALRIPDSMSFEAASTLPAGLTSVGQGLYEHLALPLPSSPMKVPVPVLIYGGSTATGTLAIQLAKLSGAKVITTCSPRNFDLVKSRGADVAIDYNSPTAIEDVKKAANDGLRYAFDCVGESGSPEFCYASFAPAPLGGKALYSTLLFPVPPKDRTDIRIDMVMAYYSYNEPFTKFGHKFPHKPEAYENTARFFELCEKLLAEGKLVPHPEKVMEGGLDNVGEGWDMMRRGEVRGVKLVYKIA